MCDQSFYSKEIDLVFQLSLDIKDNLSGFLLADFLEPLRKLLKHLTVEFLLLLPDLEVLLQFLVTVADFINVRVVLALELCEFCQDRLERLE